MFKIKSLETTQVTNDTITGVCSFACERFILLLLFLKVLNQDADRGQPCLKCGDACPGLALHFWR